MTDTPDTTPTVKATAYFDPDTAPEHTVHSESFWVTLIPDHPANTPSHAAGRVDNLLLWAPFTLGDTVLITGNDDERLQVIAILERAPHHSIAIATQLDDPTDIAATAATGILTSTIAQTLTAAGAQVERLNQDLLCAQLPTHLTTPEHIDTWLDQQLDTIPDEQLNGIGLAITITHTPDDPTVVAWLDTNLQQAPHDQTYTGPAHLAWDATNDPAFAAAVQQARTDEQIPAWVDDQALADTATHLWQRDQRVREAITANRHWGVAVLAFRISAPPGTLLPPLDQVIP